MSTTSNSSGGFFSLWLIAFIVIKVGGTALATWSWWWVLFPIIPDLVLIFKKLGWM